MHEQMDVKDFISELMSMFSHACLPLNNDLMKYQKSIGRAERAMANAEAILKMYGIKLENK